jgi:cytochrome c2
MKLYNTEEAAVYMGMTTASVAQQRVRYTGPNYSKDEKGRVVYTQEQLDAWLAKPKGWKAQTKQTWKTKHG